MYFDINYAITVSKELVPHHSNGKLYSKSEVLRAKDTRT